MSRREASLILGLRESASEEKVKDAHRRIMIANHPDSGGWAGLVGGGGWRGAGTAWWGHVGARPTHTRALAPRPPPCLAGGSSFIAAKVNEAKDLLLGKKKSGSNVF